jgi:hypothetical protein
MSFYLDGSPTPISFAALPVGFTALSASIKINIEGVAQPTDGLAQYWLQKSNGINGTVNSDEFVYDFSGTPPTIQFIYDEGCGLKCSISVNDISDVGSIGNAGTAPFGNYINNLRIEGTYELGGFSWTLEQPTRGAENTPVSKTNTGDIITITSPPEDDDALDLKQVTEIDLEYEDGGTQTISVTNILIQNHNLLQFTLPIIPFEAKIYKITITSSQFSGTVTLGKLLTIYFVNAPGIYRLVPGKVNDTLYDIENGGTIEVQIPDPFAKTGFVGN